MFKKIVFVLVIPCLLFLLGLWQIFRLNWKNSIIKNMNLPGIYLFSDNNDLMEFNYRNIKIDGILSNIQLYVFASSRGYYVLLPMLLTNGHYILVNKGIVKDKEEENKTKVKRVIISGVLYCDGSNNKDWLVKNDIVSNTWFTLSTKKISNELGIKLEQCMLWEKDFGNSSLQPIKHLEYAITWFALSLIWCIVCFTTKEEVHNSKRIR
ncbi:MAG: SURF1 family protein [Wolbachia endosymbiont of Menacanthus eurysternus]|nr:MAG: SURF1 family protein [Wolbachia endosymbiont of Menacanthus eurysternus]